jgi:hypothetical protein
VDGDVTVGTLFFVVAYTESEDVLQLEDVSSDWVQEYAKQVRLRFVMQARACKVLIRLRSSSLCR